MWISIALKLFYSFSPHIIKTIGNERLIFFGSFYAIILAVFCLFSKLSFLGKFRKYSSRKSKQSIMSRCIIRKKNITPLFMLLIREFYFLFKYKMSLIISALVYTIMTIFITKEADFLYTVQAFFIIDFLFGAISGVYTIIKQFALLKTMFLVFLVMLSAITIYCCIVKPKMFEKMLVDRTGMIIYSLSNF